MYLIMNTWPMDEAFLERYYSEMRDFSRYTSFIALNPVQKLSDNYLENHWDDLKNDNCLHYIFDDNRSLDFIERHFFDLKDQKQCWERIAGYCKLTPDFVQKFSEYLIPCICFLLQNPHLASKNANNEIYSLASLKDNTQLKEIQDLGYNKGKAEGKIESITELMRNLNLVDTLLCSKYNTLYFLRWSILFFSIFQRFSFIIFYSISFRLPHLLRVQLTEHHKNNVPYLVPPTAPHKGATHGTSQK